jgi:hypothetical protein
VALFIAAKVRNRRGSGIVGISCRCFFEGWDVCGYARGPCR